MRARMFALLGVACLTGGVAMGSVSLTGVEPNGVFVDCGAAVFGRPSPLPSADCTGAYAPLPQLTWAAITAGIMLLAGAAGSLVRRRPAPPGVIEHGRSPTGLRKGCNSSQ